MNQPVALVTGASSGFGTLIAEELGKAGFRVYGTSRNPERAIQQSGRNLPELLPLDLASEESPRACLAMLLEKEGRLDLLVNNAGQIYEGLAEETPPEEARNVFEVNFWGTVRTTLAALPAMRAQPGGGRIVTVSSLAGLVGTPGQAYYAASKHALEGFFDALEAELAHLPVELHLLEPGFYRTAIHEARPDGKAAPITDYDPIRDKLLASLDDAFEKGGDPAEIAAAVAAVATGRRPRFRTPVGKEARSVVRLKSWLPEGAFRKGLRKRFALEGS